MIKIQIEAADFCAGYLAGWCLDLEDVARKMELQFMVDDHTLGSVINTVYRHDLERDYGACLGGFLFRFPPEKLMDKTTLTIIQSGVIVHRIQIVRQSKRQFVFLHVPKVGGTTIMEQLRRNFNPHEIFPDEYVVKRNANQYPRFANLRLNGISKAEIDSIKLFAGHYRFVDAVRFFPKGIFFALVREPISHVISHIRHFLSMGSENPGVAETLSKIDTLTVDAFLKHYVDHKMYRTHSIFNEQSRMLLSERIEEVPENVSIAAIDKLNRQYDFLGEINGTVGINDFFARHGFLKFHNAKLNTSLFDSDAVLSNESLELIKYFNSLDFQLYNKVIK